MNNEILIRLVKCNDIHINLMWPGRWVFSRELHDLIHDENKQYYHVKYPTESIDIFKMIDGSRKVCFWVEDYFESKAALVSTLQYGLASGSPHEITISELSFNQSDELFDSAEFLSKLRETYYLKHCCSLTPDIFPVTIQNLFPNVELGTFCVPFTKKHFSLSLSQPTIILAMEIDETAFKDQIKIERIKELILLTKNTYIRFIDR